jgi:hypothetical protein
MLPHEVAEMLDAENRGCDQCYARDICWIECADEKCTDVLEKWLLMEAGEATDG